MAGSISVSISANKVGANDMGPQTWAGSMSHSLSFANGTGAGQADLYFMDERTVASASNDDLDLSGVLLDALGATITAVEIAAIAIINKPINGAANTTNLTVGAGTNPITGYLGGTTPTIGPVRPNAMVILAGDDAAGFGIVTAATGDILRIANSAGASATYQIALFLRSV